MAPDFDAAMLGIGGDMALDRRRRVGEDAFDLGPHQRPVGLQREQPFPAALPHQGRRLALAVHGVAGHQHPGQVEPPEQRACRGDLVAARRHRRLAQHQPGVAGEGGDDVQRRGSGGAVERAAQRLAVDGHHPLTILAEAVQEPPEADAERRRIERPEQPAERVVA